MQNWDNMQAAAANYEQHNNWYNSMFATADIKSEPDSENRTTLEEQTKLPTTATTTATVSAAAAAAAATTDVMSHLENYLRQQQQHQQQQQQQQQQQPHTPHQSHHQHQINSTVVDSLSTMTPSPSNTTTDSLQHLYDGNMQQQLLQQQQYQQQFQQAQQAAAHNQITSTHLPLGFNPLTPPGLPTAILPSITHFYHHQQQQQQQQQQTHANNNNNNSMRLGGQQTPSPQPIHNTQMCMATPMDSTEKLQSALTPRNTPPMDITPPKSPKTQNPYTCISNAVESISMCMQEKVEQDAQSDTSDDMKYTGELGDDDKMIREPIYNSHGKIKNYKCKSCGLIAITKVLFWEHVRTHMKPEKILQCPKCPFVTELKHHLEYHIRKHKNLKPFQCDKCSYTCVNKSMLNSHRKSHSSVYQYRCADCDYATKYCHSFKLHLRKYDHKPGLVLDEEGLPNPSVVIDVYGTRRGPKSKSSSSSSSSSNKRSNGGGSGSAKSMQNQENIGDFKLSASQLSAALQSFSIPAQHQQHHTMPVSPAKSPTSSASSELLTTRSLHGLTTQQQQQQLQQQQQQQQQQHQQQKQMQQVQQITQTKHQRQTHAQQNRPNGTINPTSVDHCTIADAKASMSNLLPPLASILQQNPNMAFFPYWNLNLQMLAAQQQAAALAQMPSNMREKALQELQNLHKDGSANAYDDSPHDNADNADNESIDEHDGDDDDNEQDDRKSTDSAMDLSQGSPLKEDVEQRKTPSTTCGYMKIHEESIDTPIVSANGAARRKGRVLKLDAILQVKSSSAESLVDRETNVLHDERQSSNVGSPIPNVSQAGQVEEEDEVINSDACVDMDIQIQDIESTVRGKDFNTSKTTNNTCQSNTSTTSTASSSGNSSNGSNTSATNSASANGPPTSLGTMYECKYCDIYFKDAVLYTIHMGYHSCDDVFKCNMCGEKCDGPVGLFVHMARNAHS